MKKLGAVMLLMLISITAGVDSGEAGSRKRGWYLKKPGATCVMRKVSAVGAGGVVRTQKIRVCRY